MALNKEIKAKISTLQEQMKMNKELYDKHSFGLDENIHCCGACGIHSWANDTKFWKKKYLEELEVLWLNDLDYNIWIDYRRDVLLDPLVNPWIKEISVDGEGKVMKNVDIRDAYSWYYSKKLRKMYYLHPELVRKNNEGKEQTVLCESCTSNINKERIPRILLLKLLILVITNVLDLSCQTFMKEQLLPS